MLNRAKADRVHVALRLGWREFLDTRIHLAKSTAHDWMAIARVFTSNEVKAVGSSKAILLARLSKADRDRLAAHAADWSVAELRGEIRETRLFKRAVKLRATNGRPNVRTRQNFTAPRSPLTARLANSTGGRNKREAVIELGAGALVRVEVFEREGHAARVRLEFREGLTIDNVIDVVGLPIALGKAEVEAERARARAAGRHTP